MVCYGKVHQGYEYPILQFAVITDTDIFGEEKRKRSGTAPMRAKNPAVYGSECRGLCRT